MSVCVCVCARVRVCMRAHGVCVRVCTHLFTDPPDAN